MSTLRKKIAEALEGESLDLREISKLFGIKEKEVLDHLIHIEMKNTRVSGPTLLTGHLKGPGNRRAFPSG